MFTGLVEEIAVVRDLVRTDGGAQLRIATPLAPQLAVGDSVAVAGVCLTVTAPGPEDLTADMVPETLARTTLGGLAPGDRVNLERALAVGDRLGGHLVQGHVDGVGSLVRRTAGPRWDDVEIAVPGALARYVAEKGSIAVDGVSLTVTHAGTDTFGVSLIPSTLAATTLGDLAAGSRVNLEVDVVAKYVERLVAR